MLAELALLAYAISSSPAAQQALAALNPAAPARPPIVAYVGDQRAVSNWRGEAARHLDLDPATARDFAAGGDPRPVARCVKLNNYWCIKGVGWNGMLAADAEGHAAFSSAPEGAAVAALLLRRYYLDFSRRSAQAIVSRWAPAQCGGLAMPVRARPEGAAAKGFRMAQTRRALGAEPKVGGAPLATRGLGNTLRARFLAARGGPRVAKGAPRGGIRRSIVADRAPPMLRTPTIASGLGAMELALTPKSALSLVVLASRVTPASFAPMTSCAGDSVRIRDYAMKVIDGVTASPDEDLKLFEPDGAPTERLAKVMFNMASVEIGPLKADPELIRIGIETATAAMLAAMQARAAVEAEAAPGRP